MTKLLTTKIKLIAAAGVLAAAFWSGWGINDYRWQAKYSKLAADHTAELHRINNEYIADVAVMAEAADNLRIEIAAKDKEHQEVVTNARAQQEDLRRTIRDGDHRLSVLVRKAEDRNCHTLPEAAHDTGLDDGETRAELDPAAAERIVAIVNEADDNTRQLNALIDVCSITHTDVPLTQ